MLNRRFLVSRGGMIEVWRKRRRDGIWRLRDGNVVVDIRRWRRNNGRRVGVVARPIDIAVVVWRLVRRWRRNNGRRVGAITIGVWRLVRRIWRCGGVDGRTNIDAYVGRKPAAEWKRVGRWPSRIASGFR